MKKLVVDASVSLKWAFEEEDSDIARSLLDAYEKRTVLLLAPSLWEYEIVNAISVALRRGKMTSHRSALFFSLLLKASPELIALSDMIRPCLANARKYNISGYDSAYVTLAKEQGIVLISSDEKLVASVADKKIAISLMDYSRQYS